MLPGLGERAGHREQDGEALEMSCTRLSFADLSSGIFRPSQRVLVRVAFDSRHVSLRDLILASCPGHAVWICLTQWESTPRFGHGRSLARPSHMGICR